MIGSQITKTLQDAAREAIETIQPIELLRFPIAYLRTNFEPPNDQKYWEIIHIVNNPPDRYADDGPQVYRGIFRVILHWSKTGDGDLEPSEIAEQLVLQLKKAKTLFGNGVRVQIIQTPKLDTPLVNDTDLMYPITMNYQCFA